MLFHLMERYLQQVPRSVEIKFTICINIRIKTEHLIHSRLIYGYTTLKLEIYKKEKIVIIILITIKIINFIFKFLINLAKAKSVLILILFVNILLKSSSQSKKYVQKYCIIPQMIIVKIISYNLLGTKERKLSLSSE